MLPKNLYTPKSTLCFEPIVSDAFAFPDALFTLLVICMLVTSIGLMLTAVWTVTGPLTPTDRLSPLNANTCPKLRTSIHSLQAVSAYLSTSFFIAFNSSHASARSWRLSKPSSFLSLDCTNIYSPRSWRRFLIFLLRQTSDTSPYPS